MKTRLLILSCLITFLCASCAIDEVSSISEIERLPSFAASLEVVVYDVDLVRDTEECNSGCTTGQSTVVAGAQVELFRTESDAAQGDHIEVLITNSNGEVKFTSLVKESHFVRVTAPKGQESAAVNTPKGQLSKIQIGI